MEKQGKLIEFHGAGTSDNEQAIFKEYIPNYVLFDSFIKYKLRSKGTKPFFIPAGKLHKLLKCPAGYKNKGEWFYINKIVIPRIEVIAKFYGYSVTLEVCYYDDTEKETEIKMTVQRKCL